MGSNVPSDDSQAPAPAKKKRKKRKSRARPKSEHKRRGRPKFNPTQEEIDRVEQFCRANYSREKIADFLQVDVETMARHPDIAVHLRMAKAEMIRLGVSKLFLNVMNGDQRAIEFLLRTQARDEGWGSELALTGAHGASLFKDLDLSKLSDDAFGQLKALLRVAGAAIQDSPGERAQAGA